MLTAIRVALAWRRANRARPDWQVVTISSLGNNEALIVVWWATACGTPYDPVAAQPCLSQSGESLHAALNGLAKVLTLPPVTP